MSAPTLLYSTSLLGFLPYGQVLSRVTGHWHSRPLVAYSFNYNTSLLLLIFLLLHHMYTYIQIKHQSRSRETDFTTKLQVRLSLPLSFLFKKKKLLILCIYLQYYSQSNIYLLDKISIHDFLRSTKTQCNIYPSLQFILNVAMHVMLSYSGTYLCEYVYKHSQGIYVLRSMLKIQKQIKDKMNK